MARAPRADNAEAAHRVAAVMALNNDDAAPGPIANGQQYHTDAIVAANVAKLAAQAELARFSDLYSYEVKTLAALTDLDARGTMQLLDRRLVDDDLILEGLAMFEDWAIQRGLRKPGGNGAGS